MQDAMRLMFEFTKLAKVLELDRDDKERGKADE